jgi:hypothetical protein
MSRKISLSIIVISTIFAASIVTLTGFGSVGIAQGQANPTLTPEQKTGMCDPNDKFVNTTESRICGIPKTPASSANATTSENNTSSTISPSVIPST